MNYSIGKLKNFTINFSNFFLQISGKTVHFFLENYWILDTICDFLKMFNFAEIPTKPGDMYTESGGLTV